MALTAFKYEVHDNIAHITLNQPERGNPFDRAFCSELTEVAVRCTSDPAVRAVLIDSHGKFFSVGGDIFTLTKSREALPDFVEHSTGELNKSISLLARGKAPIVVAVHALAAGGAVGLVSSADFVVASSEARFYPAFPGIGITCDSGCSYFLPRRMGFGRASRFLMLNEIVGAEEALNAGLVDRMTAPGDLASEALALAKKLAAGPTLAYGELKGVLDSSFGGNLENQLLLEAQSVARMAKTEDAWNAMLAVAQKKKAVFHGR